MLTLVFGIILSLCGIGEFIYLIINSKTSVPFQMLDRGSKARRILWIAIGVILLAGGIMLIVSHFMGW